MYSRFLSKKLTEALSMYPVSLLLGGRQVGKTTLARLYAGPAQYTFDDWTTREAAQTDPDGWLQGVVMQAQAQFPIFIDEIQLVPELFRSIKRIVDLKRIPGMFLLTGSSDLLHWPQMPDSLAGRMTYLTLYPLAAIEKTNTPSTWIDDLFTHPHANEIVLPVFGKMSHFETGYPAAMQYTGFDQQLQWIKDYLRALIERDIVQVARIDQRMILQRCITLLAQRVTSTLNFQSLSEALACTTPNIQKYLKYLELLYLCASLQPWSENLGKRLRKSPKIYMSDVGILHALAGVRAEDLAWQGVLREQWIYQELMKQISWSSTQPNLYFWRTTDGHEIDFVLENSEGQLVAIEVKSAHTLQSSHWKSLKIFSEKVKDRLIASFVIYQGTQPHALGDRIWAVPL